MKTPSPLTGPLAMTAGLAYGLIIFCGLSAEFWVRSKFLHWNDPAATVADLIAHQQVFRLGFIGELAMVLADLILGVIFYHLLKSTNQIMALWAMVLRLAQAVMISVALLASLLPLRLLGDAAYTGLEPAATQALSLLAFETHRLSYSLAMIFFGINCMVTGFLLVRATWAPSILGRLLFLAGPAYLADSLAGLLLPAYQAWTAPFLGVAVIAEVSMCGWLIWKGLRPKGTNIPSSPRPNLPLRG
ncbi:MAG: DUF4386 domain-containing protein [bacterium]|nr:DUF4386 domain-containing protein [bacterium]